MLAYLDTTMTSFACLFVDFYCPGDGVAYACPPDTSSSGGASFVNGCICVAGYTGDGSVGCSYCTAGVPIIYLCFAYLHITVTSSCVSSSQATIALETGVNMPVPMTPQVLLAWDLLMVAVVWRVTLAVMEPVIIVWEVCQ